MEMASEAREESQSIINTLEEQVEMDSEAREERQNIINTLDDLDIAQMTFEAWEERDNIYYMLAELLAKILLKYMRVIHFISQYVLFFLSFYLINLFIT